MTADITGLLIAWSRGDEAALDGLMSAMYPELRRTARIHLSRRRRGQTLESAAVANEAYLKLLRGGSLNVENRVHFLALCLRIIRQILGSGASLTAAFQAMSTAVHFSTSPSYGAGVQNAINSVSGLVNCLQQNYGNLF
jgi:RNA polymerase sigma-70 factor (ECF subfamily)